MSINRLALLVLCALCVLAAPCFAAIATVLVADTDHDTFLSKADAVYVTSCGGSAAATNTANTRIFVGDRHDTTTGNYTNYKGFLHFDIKDLHGTPTSAKLYMYRQTRSNPADIYVLRPHSYWWPGDSGDWTGAADTLGIKAFGDIVGAWNEFVLDITYIPMGRYLDIRLEDSWQQTCDTPPGAGTLRWSVWRSKDYNGTGDDDFTPYLVIDYDSTAVTCASVYVPSGASDGYLLDEIQDPNVCDGIEASPLTGVTVIVVGEDDAAPSAAYGFIRFSLAAIPDSIQSAWMTFTIDFKGAANFGNVELWKLDTDFDPLTAGDWGASGTEIGQISYDSVAVGQTIAFDVTANVSGGLIEPFQLRTSGLCTGPGPLDDERIWVRASEYAGTSSDPVLTVCYFPSEARYIIKPVGITGGSLGDASGKFMGKAGK